VSRPSDRVAFVFADNLGVMHRIRSGRPIDAFLAVWLGAAAASYYTADISGQGDSGAPAVLTQAGPGYPPPPGLDSGGAFDRPSGDVVFSGGIVNRMSNKALDVQDRSTRTGAGVQQWAFAGQPNQRWNVVDLGRGEFAIVGVGSGQVLGVAAGDLRNGASVEHSRWIGSGSQRWRLQKNGAFTEVINAASGKCLDVQDKNPRDGANIQQWDCSGADNQSWRFQP
jgi:hypothetical protein